MDQITTDVRTADWVSIIKQCQNRPEGQTAKQWLEENGISSKKYYYWLRKIRNQFYNETIGSLPVENENNRILSPRLAYVELPTEEPKATESNFEIFGEMFTTTSKERRYFTQALGSMVYDVMDDYIVHASIHPYLSSERSAALAHLQTLEALDIYTNSIVTFDRGYYSEALFRYCVDRGHLCVMRLKESMNIVKKCHGDFRFIL